MDSVCTGLASSRARPAAETRRVFWAAVLGSGLGCKVSGGVSTIGAAIDSAVPRNRLREASAPSTVGWSSSSADFKSWSVSKLLTLGRTGAEIGAGAE
jgi:hypothetical protein